MNTDFWNEIIKYADKCILVNDSVYYPCESETDFPDSSFLGHGGRCFEWYLLNNPEDKHITNNLWYNGIAPDYVIKVMKDHNREAKLKEVPDIWNE